MCASSAVSSSFSLPYASFRYWISFRSRVVCSAIGEDAYPVAGPRNDWDDDDWTGEPPEGRYDASRANPGFWRQARPPLSITAAGLGIALIVLLLVWLL